MEVPGASRQQLASALSAAYADGLLSADTLSRRLDQLFCKRLIDPSRLVGDLTTRRPGRTGPAWLLRTTLIRLRDAIGITGTGPMLLALDWTGEQDELFVGRHTSCDVRLGNPTVSRLHARLIFRDACWIVQDLESRNGTTVNGKPVGRCRLAPGDYLAFADEHVRID
jgi:FHA domain